MTTVSNVKMQFIKQKNYNNLKEWCEDPNNIYIGRKGIVFINKERYQKMIQFGQILLKLKIIIEKMSYNFTKNILLKKLVKILNCII